MRQRDWSAGVLTVLVPVIVAGGLVVRPLSDGGLLWPALGILAVIGLLAGSRAVPRGRGEEPHGPHRPGALAVPVSLIVFWLVLVVWFPYALGQAPDRFAGEREVTYLAQAALFTVPALLLTQGRARGIRAQRRGWILALVLCAVIATWELTTGQHLWITPENPWPFGDAPRAAGTLINPNNLATALVGMIAAAGATLARLAHPVGGATPFRAGSGRTADDLTSDGVISGDPTADGSALVAGERSGRRVGRRLAQAALALLIAYACVIIVLSGSRAALAALAGVAVLHGWRLLRERAGGRGVLALLRRHLRIVVALVVVAVGGFVGLLFAPESLIARNPFRRMVFGHLDPATAASDDLRAGLVRAAMRYLEQSGYLGSGAGSFEALLAADPAPGVITQTNLHQAFVELLSQYGVVVGAAFAVAVLVTIGALLASAWADRRALVGPARERRIGRHEAYGYLLSYGAFGASASSAISYPAWWLALTSAVAIAWWLAGDTPTRADRMTLPSETRDSDDSVAGSATDLYGSNESSGPSDEASGYASGRSTSPSST